MSLQDELNRLSGVQQQGKVTAKKDIIRNAFERKPQEMWAKPQAKLPVAKTVAKKAPTYSGRLSGNGMNLGTEEYKASYSKLYDSPAEQRAAARTSAIGHNIVGGLASAFETGQQRSKDFTTNYPNRREIISYNESISLLSRKRAKLLSLARTVGKDQAEKDTGLNLSTLDRQLEATKEKLSATEVDTVVDQNKYGQWMLEVAANKQLEAKQGLGKVGGFLSDATVGIGSSVPAMAVSVVAPEVGLPIIGAMAAGQKSHDLSKRGIGSKEAWSRGVGSGLIEAGTEAVPIAKLAKLARGTGGKQFIKGILEQAGTEATEESIAYTANFLADKAAKDPEAKFSLSELAQSAGTGAVSGGVLGGAVSVGNRAINTQIGPSVAPRLPHRWQVPPVVSEHTAAAKPLGLPSPRIAVTPNGEAMLNQQIDKPSLNVQQRVEKTGETVLRNADEFDFKTLSDEQVQSVNSIIKAAQRENITPKEYIDRVAKPFDDVVEKAVVDLSADLQAYAPQGVSINQETGIRMSNNEKWYSDAFSEKGRAPNKAERAEVARKMVMQDIATQRGQYVPQDAAQGYNMAQSFREQLTKIDGDAVNVSNVGDTTVVERGRTRHDVIPNYSPVNAKQIIQRVQETAAQHNVPQETIDRVSAIAAKFNAPVEFVDSLGDRVNGKYENGKITIAKDTQNPVMAVFTHELTHHIETSGQYETLTKRVQDYMGADFTEAAQGIKKLYAQEGVQLDDAGAAKEAVATFIENRGLFEDEVFVQRLTRENPSLARRVMDWIKDTIRKIGASADTKFLIDAQRLYEKAMRDGLTSGQSEQFSIRLDKDGKPFVEIDGDILDGVPKIQWINTVKDAIKTKFGGGIDMGGFMVNVSSKTASEWTYSKETLALKKSSDSVYADKMRMANNADEMTQQARNVANESPKHARKDNILSFNRGQLFVRVGKNDYSVQVVTGVRPDGSELLYDVVNVRPAKIKEADRSASPGNAQLTQDGTASLNDNVAHSQSTVNPQSMQNGKNNAQQSRSDVTEIMQQYTEKYGAIKQGENPHREAEVPKKTPRGKTRKFTRTMMESEAIPDSMIGDFEEAIVNGTFAYSPMSDKAALTAAERTINDSGFNGALTKWDAVTNGKKYADKNDIVLGEMLLNQAANAGDVKLAMKLAAEIAAEGTRAGQNVQALRLLKRMTPDGQLYYLQKTVQKVNSDLLDRLKLKAPNVKIDETLAKELLNAQSQQEIEAATENIYQNIADQMPANWIDKWNAWRYLSMLGNPRTHIRNLIGNGIFIPAVQIKNLIATPMEARLPQAERTKAVLTKKDADLKDFARADFANIKVAISSGGKLNPSDVIRDKQAIFKTKLLEKARKGNLNALEKEDAIFLKMHYTSAMTQVMKSQGLTPEFLKNGSKEANQALEDARNYSIQEAQKATYRDASKLANALNKFKKSGPVGAVLGEGIMPFTKTPINILKRGIEYSPVGLIGGVKSSLVDVKKGTKTASQAIDQMASGLTGTGIVALGAWLASMGLVSGGRSDDKKESLFDRLQGAQNYALKLGDYTYTLDWAAPASLPLFVGVEMCNMLQGEKADASLATILDSLTKISEPMVDMSMLQGINRLLKAGSYSQNPLSDAIAETVTGYFGQGVPTFAGQVARTIDGKRRTRFIDKNSGNPEFFQKFAQTQQAKLPFVSKGLIPYVDAWGREQDNGGALGRAAQNFLSPGYVSKNKSKGLDNELDRLYKATGESAVLPSYAAKYVRFDNETKNFTAEEYFTYASEKGQMSYRNLDDLVNSAAYSGMSDEVKVDAISSIYAYANAIAKTKVSDYELSKSMQKAQEAEKSGIKPSQYFMANTAQKDVEGDSDGTGGTIDGTAKINKRKAVDGAAKGMSFEKKDALYKALGVGLSEQAERKWSVPAVQKAVGSKEKYYKVQDLISSIKADKDEYGYSVSGTAKPKELAAISKELNVSREKASKIYDELVTFKHSIEEMSSSEQDDWKQFKAAGMGEKSYIKYNNAASSAKGLKDANGKTVSGSLKNARYSKLLQSGMTAAQARNFLSVRYNYKW